MDVKRVNAAVKIKIALDRRGNNNKLWNDLSRLIKGMTNEEYNEYVKRIR